MLGRFSSMLYTPYPDNLECNFGDSLLEHLALDGSNLKFELRGLTATIRGRKSACAPRRSYTQNGVRQRDNIRRGALNVPP